MDGVLGGASEAEAAAEDLGQAAGPRAAVGVRIGVRVCGAVGIFGAASLLSPAAEDTDAFVAAGGDEGVEVGADGD